MFRIKGLGSLVFIVFAAFTTPARAALPTGLDKNGHFLAAQNAHAGPFSFVRLQNGVQFRLGAVSKNVIFYAPGTARVNANLGENYWAHPSIVVIQKPHDVKLDVRETSGAVSIVGPELRIAIDKKTGALTFMDRAFKVLTRERADAPQSIKRITVSGAPTYEVENRFTLKPDEAIYGFGFTGDDETNRRRKELLLVQTNVGSIVPMMVSTEHYGVMWDTYSVMRFKDDEQGARLSAESAPGGVDYYFMAGDTMDDVVSAYRKLTGAAPMYPKQAFGLFMSKERYETQDRILEVARTFRKEQFPLDYIVQDWQYWGSDKDGTWSGMIWNPERFPDPQGMTKAIHDLHMKLMISIWPSIGNDTALAHELDQHGLRFEPLHWISKKARVYDAYSAKGREIYFKHLKAGLLDKGVDALWMDGTEVEVGTATWNALENVRDIKSLGINAMGDFSRYLNPYTLVTTQGVYDGQRATGDKRVLTLTRSAWAGAQRTGATSWTGDIYANWKTLKQQVAGGVNVTVTGNPYWTQDTGGFFVADFPGGEKNAAYRELFTRWFQFSAFNPIMRVHGTHIEREPYIFKTLDPPMHKRLLDATHLRYRLLPYIYSLSAKVTAEDYTLMRALPMDFPADKATHAINDSFMFGPSLLVHPVTRAMFNILPPPASTIPRDYLRTPDGKPGLALEYFAGENFEESRSKLIDQNVDHNWPDPPLAEPPPGLTDLAHFSARWEGQLIAPEDGEYEIGVAGNDGFRLFLDGEQVLSDWAAGAERYRNTLRTFRKGQEVAVKIEYYQINGNRVLRFAWRTPSDRRALESAKSVTDIRMQTYLPKGVDWCDFWTNQCFTGGQTVSKDAPLDIIPLYVRAGSIMPMGPIVQYATEQPDAPYEVRIYPGADGRFTIHEDDNETYRYEKGEFATYDLAWNDASKTLTIGARKGAFPGMTRQRQLNLVLADPAHATAIEPGPIARSVTYTGEQMVVTLGR